MFDVLRAEALKIRTHRATWLMVWIFPIFFGLALVVQLGRDLLYGASVPAPGEAANAALWLHQSTMAWRVPLDGTGRFVIAGFAALVFAGEYGWNTWKLVVPTRARWQLIAGKWCIVVGFIVLALAASNFLGLVGSGLRVLASGSDVPQGVTLAAILKAQGAAATNALVPLLFTVACTGLFAVLTGSLLGTVGLSIVIVLLEQMLVPLALLLYGYASWLSTALLQVLPFYHVANFIAAMKGARLVVPLGEGNVMAVGWGTSLTIVLAWILAIGAVTLLRFSRQDLN